MGKRGRALLAIGLAALIVPSTASAGPVILGGDDLQDHGSVDGAGEPQQGWLYIQKAIANLKPNVTRANDNSIAALGSTAAAASESGNAGAAIGVAANKNGMGINYYNGADAINNFFNQLASGAVNPSIIWLAGTGATNSYDDEGGCGTGPADENGAVVANASRLDNYVGQGGGLMSHGTCYQFLATLLPGLETVESGGSDDLFLTGEGQQAFPGLTNADINAGPWHNHFQGNFGGLQVLARSNAVRDAAGAEAAVIIGGSAVNITPPADLQITKTDRPDPVTVGRDLTYTLTVRNNGPGAAQNVTVTDTLPAGVRFRSARSSPGTCTSGATVSCAIGSMASGATATVTIVVRPTRGGSITNTAAVATTSTDPNTANNTARTTTRARTIPRLSVAPVAGCRAGTFGLTVRVTDSTRISRVDVRLDGRRILRTTRKSFTVRVAARGLRSGRHRLVVSARNTAGGAASRTRLFTRCPRARPRFTG